MSEHRPVTFHEGDDPEIAKASEDARKTFQYFWKQVSCDFNRIVPALEIACVKAAFSDDDSDPNAHVEHINYDGAIIRGNLTNSPNALKSVKNGDAVECKVEEVSDWICVLAGRV